MTTEAEVWEQFEREEKKILAQYDGRRNLDEVGFRLRREQAKKDAAAAKAQEEENAARFEKLRTDNVAALDARYKAHELSIWQLSGRTDAAFEAWWPSRRGELARAEVDQHVAAVTHNFYSDL
jgi:hypothetical protein